MDLGGKGSSLTMFLDAGRIRDEVFRMHSMLSTLGGMVAYHCIKYYPFGDSRKAGGRGCRDKAGDGA